MSKKTGGIIALIVLAGLSVFLLNCGTSNSRPAGVLFVTSQGASSVGSYAIDLNTGNLSQLNTSAGTAGVPEAIVLDQTHTVAFVLDQAPPAINAYTIKSDGSLSAAGSPTPVAGDTAIAMASDTAGKFLFEISAAASPSVSVFTMQSGSTTLSQVGNPIPLTRIPTSVNAITFTPPGSSTAETLLYITSDKDLAGTNDDVVSEYSVDGSGNATELPGSPYVTTTAAPPVAVLAVKTPANNLFVYVTNTTPANNISIFQVCIAVTSNCTQSDVNKALMTPVGTPVLVGLAPVALITDPTSNFLYVANQNSNTVSEFRINPNAGTLTPLNPQTVSTGVSPVALTMHPSGKFIYVSNSGSSSVSGFGVNTASGVIGGALVVSSSAQPAALVAK